MSLAKLRAGGTADIMKSDEGNNSVDTFIRQAVGREPLLSFSRTGESQVQWIQFLHALDQQDIPGWPLLSPLKVQMQKCDKCSREFCSPINYRRHIRVHRRSLNFDKESHKNRDLLGAFWDKLSLEEAKEIASFTDVTLEETPGSSVIKALISLIRKPGFCALPQVYLRAGSGLLEIVQARPSRLPISSQELFSILDDASERTFLSAGTAESMQKYVFDGEAGKIGLEMKNVVACTSFLIEQKLVKAWLADKDAEALRCQKLLVEEEEAAHKRQADILERKRQKKLRQKEQRAKELPNGDMTDVKEFISDTSESPSSAETSTSPVLYESCSDAIDSLVPIELLNAEETDIEAQLGFNTEHTNSGTCLNVEHRTIQGSGRRHLVHARWQVPKSQRRGRNGFHASQNLQVSKLEPAQKHGSIRDARAGPTGNGHKVWTRKSKPENDWETLKSRLSEEATNQTDQSKKCEVMIGSISVTLGNGHARQGSSSASEAPDINSQEKNTKADPAQFGTNRNSVKLWRPVSRHETRGPVPVQSGNQELEVDVIVGKSNDRIMASESCQRSLAMDENGGARVNNTHPFSGEVTQPEDLHFSSGAAKAFLAERWKEAIAAEHVKLVLSPKSEPPGCPNGENQLDSSTSGNTKAKFWTHLEKNIKIKYIPKQRTVA